MISQSLHSKISYEPKEWFGAVRSDLLGEQRISLQTPSSSIGEMVTNKKLQRKAIVKAIRSGHKEILKRAYQCQKEGEFERSAKMFAHIGKRTEIVFFLVKAAVLFEKIGNQEEEAAAFTEILRIDPNNPLKFWLGNKVELAHKIKALPTTNDKFGEIKEKQDNIVLLSILAFGAGVGLGIV